MTSVIVAGAGIGGLTAALCLHRAGIQVSVFESAQDIRGLGVGINVQPHAVRELGLAGLEPQLAAIALPTAELVYFNKHGQRIWGEKRGLAAGYKWPQYSIHRGALQGILAREARARLGEANVLCGHHLAGFEQEANGVVAHFIDRRSGEARGSHRADVLVGADGVHSVVRGHFYPDEGTPRWSGQMMWRGITRMRPFLSGKSMIMAGHRRQKIVAYPINPSPGADGLIDVNWVAEETFDGEATPPREDWNRSVPLSEIVPLFAGWKFDWLDVPAMLQAGQAAYEFPKVDRDAIPRWSFDRVTLLGDAAHPMHPAGSNGATQAIVDAPALAEALAANADPVAALRAYESVRLPAVTELARVNREKMGPEWVMILAEERAPGGFKNVLDVLSREELEQASTGYRSLAGFDRARS